VTINEAVRIISKPDGVFSGLEEEQVSKNGDLSKWVVPSGFEPEQTEPKSVVLPLHHGTLFDRLTKKCGQTVLCNEAQR
jgi:hypothetical protein